MRRREGMTLVEIGVAFAILALALLPIINLFTGSGRQARQTADFNQGVTLGEKVAEELRLANWENVHLFEDLAADPQAGTSVPIIDAQSHWFATLEDDSPPFGQILPGQDSGITIATGPLYRQLEYFDIAVASRSRTLPATGKVYDVDLTMSWRDFRQKRQDLPFKVVLGDYGHWNTQPSLMQDRAAADDQIRQTLYPTATGQTLKEAVGPPPGDYSAAQMLGDVVLLMTALLNTETAYQQNVTQLRAAVEAASTARAQAEAQVDLARAEEARASVRLAVILYLAPRVYWLAGNYDIVQMGSPSPPYTSYAVPVAHLQDLTGDLERDMKAAEDDYVTAFDSPLGPALPPRVRDRVLFKVVDIHELRALTSGSTGLSDLQAFLKVYSGFEEGRNPNFASFARHESDDCKDLQTLAQTYRLPERIDGYQEFAANAFDASYDILMAGVLW